MKAGFSVIGKSLPKVDAVEKALGKATYSADIFLHGMLCAKIVRSSRPHAKILRIDTSPARAMKGVAAVLTASDIPGVNHYGLSIPDQPVLAQDKVRCVGDPVALVAAEDEQIALKAADAVKVHYEDLPAVFSPEEALMPGAPKVHEGGNLLLHTKVSKGDVERGFAMASAIVKDVYKAQKVGHAYLETESGVAVPERNGTITVWSSTQYPFRDRRQMAPVLRMPASKIRVAQAAVGGGFGGKDDITVEIHLALLALKTGRPVRLIWSREESLAYQKNRHSLTIEYKSGADRDGMLTAVEVAIYADTGAYAGLGHFTIKKCAIHSPGPYFVPNIKADSYCVYTNNPMSGSMRGFGVVQAAFAHESQMDMLAEKLGISPLEIRLKNVLEPGKSTSTGQVLHASVGAKQALLEMKKFAERNNISLSAR